jgi:serine/threonine protein kinase
VRAIKRIGLEVEALRELSPHENINRLVDALHTPDFVHLVLERADSDLLDWYEGALPEAEARHVTGQLARALEHCHANGFAHRDLKSEVL